MELAAKTDTVEVSGTLKLDKAATKTGQLPLLSQVNSVARTIAQQLKHPYYILIDDLDLHWSGTPTQEAFVAALFLSARKMSLPPHLKFVVAVREDIYRRLPLEDKDKSRDNICHVKWDKDTIKDMIEKRIRIRLKTPPGEIWSSLFPSEAFDLLWKHTSGKPRELIRLTSLCLHEARNQGHYAVETQDIEHALHQFSGERIEDAGSEWRHEYPGLDGLIRQLKGYPREFGMDTASEFAYEAALAVSEQKEAKQYSWAGGYSDDPRELARILCRCGILLYKASRTAAPERFDSQESPPVGEKTWFAVHPMYQPFLGCR